MNIDKALLAIIKKADRPALVLIIVGLLTVFLLQIYKSDDPALAMFQLAGGILVLIGFGTLVLYYYEKNKSKTQGKPRTIKPSVLPKTIFCPNCKLMVEPVKLGKLYRCPFCPYEFKSFGETLKDFEKGYKLVKDIARDD